MFSFLVVGIQGCELQCSSYLSHEPVRLWIRSDLNATIREYRHTYGFQ